jgi:hypothetical protein
VITRRWITLLQRSLSLSPGLQLLLDTSSVTTQRVPLQLEICNTPEELPALALDWFNGIYGKKFHKRKLLALGDSASMTLLQPMPLKSRFFLRCSVVPPSAKVKP